MRNNFILLIKGFLIGIGKIIPGVSGALIAITLNVYDKGISSITKFFDDIKDNAKFLFFIGLGILLSIVTFSKLVAYLLNNHYFITMIFFIGLMIGGIPSLIKKHQFKLSNNIIFIISFIIIILFSLINTNNTYNITNTYNDYFHFFFAGLIDASSTVIPGISGTAMLMLFGYYNAIITALGNLSSLTITLTNLNIIIPFTAGLTIGIIIITKIISFFLTHHNSKTFSFINGITISTILILIINTLSYSLSLWKIIISLPIFILGFFISKKLG
ncbi:MAG: DUF368 domain-containing protein [bacterium]|nr:DUF368 domain-containing protein [bacterium]